MNKLFRWLVVLWFVVYSALFTPLAYAATAGGWSFSAFDVATSVVTAVKNGASASVAVAKSPISQKIAKGIVGGAIAGAALPLAISQISGISLSALDWLFDAENNQIKYKDTSNPATSTYMWAYSLNGSTKYCYTESQCSSGVGASSPNWNKAVCTLTSTQQMNCLLTKNGSYVNRADLYRLASDQAASNNYKTIPIPTVADKIYDNAKTDSASASIVNDAVKEYVNEGSADTALDNAKADADATHNCGTGTSWNGSACVADTPATPTTPTTPDTPFDPSSILDAIGKVFDAVMSLPDVINNALDDLLNSIKDFFQPAIDKVNDFVDWVKTEPTPVQAEPVDIQTPELPQMESTDITFGGQCPQNFDIDIDLFGKPVKFTLFDSSVFCQFLSDWIRIPVIFSASLVAVYILGGRRSD